MRAARVMISFHLVFRAKFSVSQRLDAKDGDEVQFLFYRERGAPILEDGSNRRKLAGIWRGRGLRTRHRRQRPPALPGRPTSASPPNRAGYFRTDWLR